MNQMRYKKIYFRVWSGKLYKLVRIEGVKYDCETKQIIQDNREKIIEKVAQTCYKNM